MVEKIEELKKNDEIAKKIFSGEAPPEEAKIVDLNGKQINT